jgi:hypothetical protein
MQTDGRTDISKLLIAFRNFAKTPEKSAQYIVVFADSCNKQQYYKKKLCASDLCDVEAACFL